MAPYQNKAAIGSARGDRGLGSRYVTTDFSTFEFIEGATYRVELELASDAVQVTHHGEGHPGPRRHYGMLEYIGAVGSGPWRVFRDWESEAEVTVNSHRIVAVEARQEH